MEMFGFVQQCTVVSKHKYRLSRRKDSLRYVIYHDNLKVIKSLKKFAKFTTTLLLQTTVGQKDLLNNIETCSRPSFYFTSWSFNPFYFVTIWISWWVDVTGQRIGQSKRKSCVHNVTSIWKAIQCSVKSFDFFSLFISIHYEILMKFII